MEQLLQKPVTLKNILKSTIPTMCMLISMALYSMIDGVFVANYVGTNALSAVNLVMPVISITIGIATMLSSGGCALSMTEMGKGNEQKARGVFNLIVITAVIFGGIISILGMMFAGQLTRLLGATNALFGFSQDYLFYFAMFAIPMILKFVLEQFLVAAGHARLAFLFTVIGGFSNVVLDYLLIKVFGMEVKGAAIATGISYLMPCLMEALYIASKRTQLYFSKPLWNPKELLFAMGNGSSEMLAALSAGIVTYLFNQAMLFYRGEDGIAAITIVLYAQFIFTEIFIGYSMGVAPMISFYHGSKNTANLKKLLKISFRFVLLISIALGFVMTWSAPVLVGIFASGNSTVFQLAVNGFRLFAISFLFVGSNIFMSGMFTALSNGKVSALLSVCRTLLFIFIGLQMLPSLFDLDGIWLTVPFAETAAILLSLLLYFKNKARYAY